MSDNKMAQLLTKYELAHHRRLNKFLRGRKSLNQ